MRIDGNTSISELYHSEDELVHYGIKGMKWGVRRYQNKDGSLTPAGKKRLSKSIQKAYRKGMTNKEYSKLTSDVGDDLVTNYKKQLRSHVEDIKNKKKKYEFVDEIDEQYWRSDAIDKANKRAYNETLEWFKKADPEYLKIITERNGGQDRLWDFHDFRKTYEGYQDAAWTEDMDKIYKEHGLEPNEARTAYTEYRNACKTAARDVLGIYGNIKVDKAHSWQTDTTVHKIVEDALVHIDLDRFD